MLDKNIVSTSWLADHLQDAQLRIVDIRGKVLPATAAPPHYISHREQYEESHIPGAVFIDWTKDIVAPGSASSDILNAEDYAALMSCLGIGPDTTVVAYDDAGSMLAARLWWTLNYYGFENVAVLDGGWQKWLKEEGPVSTALPVIKSSTFQVQVKPSLRVTAEDILSSAENTPLIDVRSVQEFEGKASRARRAGHIPGAINLPRSELLNADGTLPSPQILRTLFGSQGLSDDDVDPIFYCNSGVSASYALLAYMHAGFRNGRVYDGSWKDWANDENRPIADTSA